MTFTTLLDRLLDLISALERAWRDGGRHWPILQASPEDVTAFRELPEGKALADLLLAQSPAVVFMLATLQHIGLRRTGDP
jgi:hypothetical protein